MQRPKLKTALSVWDKIVEGFCILIVSSCCIYLAIQYSKLPDTIPIHFSVGGEVDRYGDKIDLIIVSAVFISLFLGLTVLNRFPHHFNYLTKITKENVREQYTLATKMIRFLKLIISILFVFVIYVSQNSSVIMIWALPTLLFLIFTVLAYGIYKSLKPRNNKY